MLSAMRQDVRSVLDRDPAARSAFEVLLSYPGLHAVWGHRTLHWLWSRGWRLTARAGSHAVRALTGIDIHPAARIGPALFIDHGAGVVIGETAEVGADVTLYQGVTLGGTSISRGKRHPTIEDRVVVGAGAKVLGGFTVGHDSRIGANAVVVRPVPAYSVVVGVPGKVIERRERRTAALAPDLNHGQLPDEVGAALAEMRMRLELLERRAARTRPTRRCRPTPSDAARAVQDYVI